MDKIKVIYLISNFPPYHLYKNSLPSIYWKKKDGEIVGFWDYEWGNQFCNHFIEQADERFVFEVWQLDDRADKVYSHQFDNGLIHRIFPCKVHPTLLHYLSGSEDFLSLELEQRLDDLLDKKEKIIIYTGVTERYNVRRLTKKYRKKLPFIFHFSTSSEKHLYFGINPEKSVKKRLKKQLLINYYKRISYIIPGTRSTLRNNLPNVCILERDGVSNVGVDFDAIDFRVTKEQARNMLGLPPEKFILFASQRLVPEKQLDKLLHALQKVESKNILLIISGPGSEEYKDELSRLITKLDLSGVVRIIGFVDLKTLHNCYIASDLFISTSISETGPDSVYKAIFFELPVLTTDTGIAYEFLKEKNAGCIIDRYDSSKWDEALFFAVNGGTIKKPEKNAVINFFSWNKISKYYLNTFYNVYQDFYGKIQ